MGNQPDRPVQRRTANLQQLPLKDKPSKVMEAPARLSGSRSSDCFNTKPSSFEILSKYNHAMSEREMAYSKKVEKVKKFDPTVATVDVAP